MHASSPLIHAIILSLIGSINAYTNIGNFLYPGEYLHEDQVMLSKNERYQLLVQSDGNVVQYDMDEEDVVWTTNTQSADADGKEVKLYMQPGSGKLILYFDEEERWSTDACHYQARRFVMQNGGNLVARAEDSTPYWTSKKPEKWASECQGTKYEASVSFTKSDWQDLVNGGDFCQPAYDRDLADPAIPDQCPDDYPDKVGALCYKACPDGYYLDVSKTMCYQNCKDGWDDVLGVCWNQVVIEPQGSYDRGAGLIPNACGSGKSKEGGLCYNKCSSGWSAFGCHCWKGLSSYGRGCGSAPSDCPSSRPHKQSGLCYKSCPNKYSIAEGPICWKDCEDQLGDGAIDTGVTCQHGDIKSYLTDRYSREPKVMECRNGELQAGFCYEPCTAGYDGVLGVCWSQNLGDSIAAILASSVQLPIIQTCYTLISPYAFFVLDYGTDDLPDGLDSLNFDPFIKCAWPLIETMVAIDDSWSRDSTTVVVSASVKAEAMAGVNVYGGLAFEFEDEDHVNVYAFTGGCAQMGTGIGIGIDGGMGLLRSVEDIDGAESFFSMGAEIFGAVDVGSSWSFDSECQISGMSSDVGVGFGPPVTPIISVESGICANFHREYLGSVTSPDARTSSANAPLYHPFTVPSGHNKNDDPWRHEDDDEPSTSKSAEYQGAKGSDQGGDYVFELKLPSNSMSVVIGLCVVLSVALMVMLCLRCRGGMGRSRSYNKVVVGMDTEMEMDDLSV